MTSVLTNSSTHFKSASTPIDCTSPHQSDPEQRKKSRTHKLYCLNDGDIERYTEPVCPSWDFINSGLDQLNKKLKLNDVSKANESEKHQESNKLDKSEKSEKPKKPKISLAQGSNNNTTMKPLQIPTIIPPITQSATVATLLEPQQHLNYPSYPNNSAAQPLMAIVVQHNKTNSVVKRRPIIHSEEEDEANPVGDDCFADEEIMIENTCNNTAYSQIDFVPPSAAPASFFTMDLDAAPASFTMDLDTQPIAAALADYEPFVAMSAAMPAVQTEKTPNVCIIQLDNGGLQSYHQAIEQKQEEINAQCRREQEEIRLKWDKQLRQLECQRKAPGWILDKFRAKRRRKIWKKAKADVDKKLQLLKQIKKETERQQLAIESIRESAAIALR